MSPLLTTLGKRLADYLTEPIRQGAQVASFAPDVVAEALRPGDVLLVEGNTRISVAIKYLTQSTWSHAALFVGDALGPLDAGVEPATLIEADIRDGVRAIPLSIYAGMHTRICRPVGLSPRDLEKVIGYAVSRIGHQYDLKNVFDLARYLFPILPVPQRWRRRMIAFGSGDPSRAICSTLIAQAFHSVHYPILAECSLAQPDNPAFQDCCQESLHIQHYSLFMPRDFDMSPYFQVVKPTAEHDFYYHRFIWEDKVPETADMLLTPGAEIRHRLSQTVPPQPVKCS